MKITLVDIYIEPKKRAQLIGNAEGGLAVCSRAPAKAGRQPAANFKDSFHLCTISAPWPRVQLQLGQNTGLGSLAARDQDTAGSSSPWPSRSANPPLHHHLLLWHFPLPFFHSINRQLAGHSFSLSFLHRLERFAPFKSTNCYSKCPNK